MSTMHEQDSQPSTSSSGKDEAEGLGTALKTGRSLLLLQLLSRLLTFALNSALLRLSTPEVLGTASIQFDLISATILFLSREGIRNALLRRDTSSDHPTTAKEGTTSRSRANERLACVPLYLGLIVAGTVTTLYLNTSSTATTSQSDFRASLGLYIFAALAELSIEPFYIRCLTSSPPRLRVRVQAEGGMAMVKSVVTFAILYVRPQRALLGFGVGQAAGVVFLVARYLWEYGIDGWLWAPRASSEPMFEPDVKALAIANTRQSLIKHLLTEADRIAVGRISPLQDQGGYAIAMNYGSLIARIIFQPIEETLLLHFSSSPTSASNAPLLRLITHLSSHLLLLLPSFLPPLLPPILSILLPKRYLVTSAPRTLQTYLCFYIPLLSLNGILEAYHAATATPAQMSKQARWMVASSAAFVLSLWVFKARLAHRLGTDTALIGASCMGMLVRIGYAFLHARATTGLDVRTLFPKSLVTVVAVGCGSVLRRIYRTGRWTQGWATWFELLGFGGALGLLTLFVIVERSSFADLQKTLKRKTA